MAVRWYRSLPFSAQQVVRLLAECSSDVSARCLSGCKRVVPNLPLHSVGTDGGSGGYGLSTKCAAFVASQNSPCPARSLGSVTSLRLFSSGGRRRQRRRCHGALPCQLQVTR